jgi:hypothetical protein
MKEYNITGPAALPAVCPPFAPAPGETPRAFHAFITWFQLGQSRSHQAVADKLNEGLATVKNWASKYDWTDRLNALNSGLLQQHAADSARLQHDLAADWAQRLRQFREQEWDAALKLLAAARCFLESFDDTALEKMTLAQVSRALTISSKIARSALAGAELTASSTPSLSPIQQQLLEAADRLYRRPPAAEASAAQHPSSNPVV